jgi:hypothetical protein
MIRFVTYEGVVQLEKVNGEIEEGLVNNSHLKLYRDNCTFMH